MTHRLLASQLLLLSSLSLTAGSALADGSEALGTPSIPIADGSATYVAGVGLILAQAGDITVPGVAAGETVVQALLYWEGTSQTQNQQGATDDITVNGGTVTGTRIGGPTLFFTNTTIGDGWSSTYRADVTGLVTGGAATLSLSGFDFDTRNNGAGLLLIVDDGINTGTMEVKDGNDVAFFGFAPPLDTTVPISFDIAPEAEARVANLSVFVSSVALEAGGNGRPTIIRVQLFEGAAQVGGNLDFVDKLANVDGDEWDSYSTLSDPAGDLLIPAGVDRLTVQCLSADSGVGPYAGNLPASLAWVGASLSVPGIPDLGSIGDTVYCDLNNNGTQDPGEPGIAGAVVDLVCAGDDGTFGTADDLIDSQMTDANGNYLFENLPAGMCSVEVDTSTVGDKVPGMCPLDFLVDLAAGEDFLDADFCFVEPPELACRVTGVGNATFEDADGFRFYTLGGQIGAPSADQPQPFGNWGHSQHRGPEGSFSFHGGTNAHGDDTFIASVTCSDPGYCNPARPAPAKQLDSTGVGLFQNARNLTGLMAQFVEPHDSRHWFAVHFEDLGEPGGGPNSTDDDADCPPEGSAGGFADCGCPDFYSIRIHATADPGSEVIYEVFGYIRRGNVQIHPPVGQSGQ